MQDMINKINKLDSDYIQSVLLKVGEPTMEIFSQIKKDLGGKLPVLLADGIVGGYLRGKGFTWEESFIGIMQFHGITHKLVEPENHEGVFKITGNGDGSVKTNFTDDKKE